MLMCIIVLDTSSTAYAQSRKQTLENIKILVKQAHQEKKKDGEITNKTAIIVFRYLLPCTLLANC